MWHFTVSIKYTDLILSAIVTGSVKKDSDTLSCKILWSG